MIESKRKIKTEHTYSSSQLYSVNHLPQGWISDNYTVNHLPAGWISNHSMCNTTLYVYMWNQNLQCHGDGHLGPQCQRHLLSKCILIISAILAEPEASSARTVWLMSQRLVVCVPSDSFSDTVNAKVGTWKSFQSARCSFKHNLTQRACPSNRKVEKHRLKVEALGRMARLGERFVPWFPGALLQGLGCWDRRRLAHSAFGALGGVKEKVTSPDSLLS